MSFFFFVSVTKQTLENVFAVPYDHTHPLCTLVKNLTQPLRLKILYFFYMEVIVG